MVEVTPEKFTADTEASIRIEIRRAMKGIIPVHAQVELVNTDGKVYTGLFWFLSTGCFGEKDEMLRNFYTGKNPGKIIIKIREEKGVLFVRRKLIKEELSLPVE